MTTLKSDLFKGVELEVLHETDGYYISMALGVSPFLALDDIPNYFVFNRQTAKIEGMAHSLSAAKSFVDYIEGRASMKEADTEAKVPVAPLIN